MGAWSNGDAKGDGDAKGNGDATTYVHTVAVGKDGHGKGLSWDHGIAEQNAYPVSYCDACDIPVTVPRWPAGVTDTHSWPTSLDGVAGLCGGDGGGAGHDGG